MNLSKKNEFEKILHNKSFKKKTKSSIYFSPINIALIKYWGKKNKNINIPMTASLSFSSEYLGTKTQIFSSEEDDILLNNSIVDKNFFNRTFEFIDLWRNALSVRQKLKIITSNNVPTSSGLASSASGFASLTFALNDFFSLNLSFSEMSELARMGSGSACRSIYKSRFVIWKNKVAKPFEFKNNAKVFSENMMAIIIVLDENKKIVSSREAMDKTKTNWLSDKNSVYGKWISQTKKDIIDIQKVKTWNNFGKIIENNSLLMHKAIREVGIEYFSNTTFEVLNLITNYRKNGLPIYATIDAGPNIVIIYQKHDKNSLNKIIDEIKYKYNAKILQF